MSTIEVLRWTVTMEIEEEGNKVTAQVESGHKFGTSETAGSVSKEIADHISERLTVEVLDKMATEGVACQAN